MTLGQSSKRDQDSLAGFFGEGVKVEINRITAAGAAVTYYTSNQEWTFRYENEQGSQVLHLHSARVSHTPSKHMLVVVRKAQRHWFQREDFLFLANRPPVSFGGTTKHSRLQLLPEPELAGRVYVHGYLVAKMDDLPCYGLNILCSGKKLKDLGVGRDRNSVKTSETTRFVPELFLEYAEDHETKLHLAQLLGNVLQDHPQSAWQYCGRSVYWSLAAPAAVVAMADSLYDIFWRGHSPADIPVVSGGSAANMSDVEHDAKYLGFQTVPVSRALYDVMKHSRHHVTTGELWERRYQELLATPNHVWREEDEADRYRAALLNTLLASFPKYLSHANVHVKALPLGNRSIIVPVKRSSPGGDAAAAAAARAQALYVVDLSALSPGEVHRRLAEDDSSFRCDDQNCACLAIALEDAAIHAIRKVHSVYEATLRRELRLEQHKHRGLGWRGASFESPHQPPAPASMPQPGPHAEQHAHATPTQTGPGAGVPGGFPSSFAGGASPAASFAGGGGPPASSAAGGGPPARNEDAGGSSADMVFERTPLLQTAELKAAVRGSLDPSGGRQPCRVRLGGLHRPGAAAAEVTAAHDCRESRGDLVQSPIVVGGGKYLFLPEGVAPSSVSAVQVQQSRSLYALLEGLHSKVFLAGQSSHSRFFLFLDPTCNVVAFNLGQAGCSGEVWDNVAFDLAEGDAAARATHWFLTACHELAHNWVRNHSSQFADVMGELVLHFAPRFRSLWPS